MKVRLLANPKILPNGFKSSYQNAGIKDIDQLQLIIEKWMNPTREYSYQNDVSETILTSSQHLQSEKFTVRNASFNIFFVIQRL